MGLVLDWVFLSLLTPVLLTDPPLTLFLVMRKEAVYTLLLNVTLFSGMRCSLAQDPRYLRFSVIEAGATTHYNLRVCFNFSEYLSS